MQLNTSRHIVGGIADHFREARQRDAVSLKIDDADTGAAVGARQPVPSQGQQVTIAGPGPAAGQEDFQDGLCDGLGCFKREADGSLQALRRRSSGDVCEPCCQRGWGYVKPRRKPRRLL